MYRTLAPLAVAALGIIAASPAQAASLDFASSQPVLEARMHFDYKDGNSCGTGSLSPPPSAPADRSTRATGGTGAVTLAPNGKGGKVISGTMPDKTRSFTHADTITFPASFLSAYTGQFEVLRPKSRASEKGFDNLSVTFIFIRGYYTGNTPPEVGGAGGGLKVTKAVTIPMTVSCGAIPKRVPNDPLKVTELKIYTSPANPCAASHSGWWPNSTPTSPAR